MNSPLETIRNLFALADQQDAKGEPTEEARTAAHAAIRLIKKHGFVLTVARAPGEPSPRETPVPSPAPNPRWEKKKRDLFQIALEEGARFLQTLDVLPKDIPVGGVQVVPAVRAGICGCGREYQRGEMVSRSLPPRCARCVSRSL